MNCNVSILIILSHIVSMYSTFPANNIDKCYFPTAAVDLSLQRISWWLSRSSRDQAIIVITQSINFHSLPRRVLSTTWTSWAGHKTLRSMDYMNGVNVELRHCRQWGWNRLHLLEVNGDGWCPGWCRAAFTGGRSRGEDLNCEPAELQQHRETDACSPQQAITHVTRPEVARKIRTRIQWPWGCSN